MINNYTKLQILHERKPRCWSTSLILAIVSIFMLMILSACSSTSESATSKKLAPQDANGNTIITSEKSTSTTQVK